MTMQGKSAIVTGGGRGIGRAIVDRLLADGARVVTCGRGERPGDLPDLVTWVQADVAEPVAVQRVVDAVPDPTLLVNCAGVQVTKTVPDSTDADWDSVVGINCRGVFNMCRAVIPRMGQGVIVNIGSTSGHVADPGMALYNASKAFVHGLTRAIAIDHGPDIRCNAICPGWIDTGMAEEAFDLAQDPVAAKTDTLSRHPAGRLGQPEDVAGLVAFLASENAAFMTGECLTIDGGLTAATPIRPTLF